MARGDKADLFFRKLRTAGLSKPAVQTLAERLDALEAADSAASSAPPRVLFVGFLGTGPNVAQLVEFDATNTGDNIAWGTPLPDGFFVDPVDPTKLHLPLDTMVDFGFDVPLTLEAGADLSNQGFPRLVMAGNAGATIPQVLNAAKVGFEVDGTTQSSAGVSIHGLIRAMVPTAYTTTEADAYIQIGAQTFETADNHAWTWASAGMTVTFTPAA